jgi:hypothetical protein
MIPISAKAFELLRDEQGRNNTDLHGAKGMGTRTHLPSTEFFLRTDIIMPASYAGQTSQTCHFCFSKVLASHFRILQLSNITACLAGRNVVMASNKRPILNL